MNKVLVVDDDTDILTVVEIILKLHRFNVQTISKWEDIYRSIENFMPDLILLDVSLGGADGRQICKALKSAKNTKHINVILFSAHYDLVNNIEGCMADGVITKPFETDNLVNTIRENITTGAAS